MKVLIPSALAGIVLIHLLLPAGTPDITFFYLLPLLVWARAEKPWPVLIPPVLLTVGLRGAVGLSRGEASLADPLFSGGLLGSALGCLGLLALLPRAHKTFSGKRPVIPNTIPEATVPQAVLPRSMEDTEWTPTTSPDALFNFEPGPGGYPADPAGLESGTSPSGSLCMKRTEAALLRSEARLQFALEGSNTGVWEWDIVTNRNYYSTVWRTMLGYGPNEIANTQEAWVEITHPDDVPVCEASIQRHLRGESPVHRAEHRLRAKDGSWRWILTQGRILQRDAAGRPLRMFGTHTDITESKKLTAALSSEKNRLELATRAGNFGVWECHFTTGTLLWDQRMHDIFGVAEEKFGGREADWVKALHPDDRGAVLEQWRVRLKDPDATSYESEFRVIHGITGETRHMRASAILVRDKQGAPSHASGLNWDVTGERHASETLIQAKEAAEAGEKARSDFMASISHELRTPMNGVLGMAELLLDSSLSPAQRNMVTVMHRSGRTLLQIINDILDFSRIEAGQMRMHPAPFLLNGIVQDTGRLLEIKAARRGISLHCRMDPGLDHPLMGDAGRIQQIVTNLVSNALKFTERGSVALSIRRLAECPDGLRFRIEVRDTGMGIPARQYEKLFAPFKQVDQSSQRKFGGTGLGLTISNQIAAAMGGRIQFESVENEGSTFWLDLTLPLSQLPVTPVSPETGDAALEPLPPGPAFRPLNLLLVEDNGANQQVATLTMEQFGHRVSIAENGLVALEMLRNSRGFDLVLMDCRMPVLDGLETTRRIRSGEAGPQNRQIPIIALTASGMPGDRERCLDMGMNGYALKPINRRDLTLALRSCGLELSGQPASIPPSEATGTLPGPTPGPVAETAVSVAVVLDSGRVESLRQLKAPDGRTILLLCAQMLLEETPPRLLALAEFVKQRDYVGIIGVSHDIAGNCANLGATALYQRMRSLQMAGRAEAEENLDCDLSGAQADWETLRSALTAFAREQETPPEAGPGTNLAAAA
ncbi:MAG: PAS domain-containing protein [Verrucomicrobiota bacterium]